MKQFHGNWPRIFHRFLGYNAATVVVLLTMDGVDRAEHETQAMPPFDLPRHERETLEVIAKRLRRSNEALFTQTVPITRSNPIGAEQNAGAVEADLVYRCAKIGVRLVDRDPTESSKKPLISRSSSKGALW